MRKLILSLFAIIILTLTYQNCGSYKSDGAANLEAEMTELSLKMKETINLTCSTNADCDQLPAGDEICGGPTHYVVFSSSETDVQTLQQFITEYTEVERKWNAETRLAGTCEFIMPYQNLSCIDNQCQVQ